MNKTIKHVTSLLILLAFYPAWAQRGHEDYEYVAEENETVVFEHPVDLAYGADGQYHYIDNFVGRIRFDNESFGGDPIRGVRKSGYAKRISYGHSYDEAFDGFELVAYEDETRTFDYPVDLAYGANGQYHYINDFVGTIRFDNRSFGGDPIRGVKKAGYVKKRVYSSAQLETGFDDYEFVAHEDERKTFNYPVDLAYGAHGRYHYINDFVGTIRFDNATFGGDPIRGVKKAGYVKRISRPLGSHDAGFDDYEFAARENETRTFNQPVDLAYGANGQYHYINDFVGTIRFDNRTFGGDPIRGVEKAGYVKKRQWNSRRNDNRFHDFQFVANENESKTFEYPVDLAYGANGQYHYIENFIGTIRFDNRTFGGDPIPNVRKKGYQRPVKRRR